MESIYYKGILPDVPYGISVWGNNYYCSVAKLLAHLEKIHLSAAKLIFKQPENPSSLTGQPSSWKSISYLYKLAELEITVSHRTLSDQILNMSDQFHILIGRNVRTFQRHN